MPGDSQQMIRIKQKLNEIIRKLDEAYRLLHYDVRIMDYREAPPHASISHSAWKFYENPTEGHLELWHRSSADWSFSHWSIIGDLTRPPSV